MSMVHASRGRLEPGSTEPAQRGGHHVRARSGALRRRHGLDEMSDDYGVIRQHIEQVVDGFDDFERASAASRAASCCREVPTTRRTFKTATGKARFTVNPPDALDVPEGHLILQTMRSHDQFNTTVYGLDDRYRGITGGRQVVFVNRRRSRRAWSGGWRHGRPGQRLVRRRAVASRGMRCRRVPDAQGMCRGVLP